MATKKQLQSAYGKPSRCSYSHRMTGYCQQPNLIDFIMRYRLPAPSSINLALKSLKDKEFLFQNPQGNYLVYDRFFGMWLKRLG